MIGEIVEMAAQKNEHGIAIDLTRRALEAIFGPNYWDVLTASTVRIGEESRTVRSNRKFKSRPER